MKVEIKINTTEGRKPYGKIYVGDRDANITIYGDSSYDIEPSWMERKAIDAAGSKGQLRKIIREAM